MPPKHGKHLNIREPCVLCCKGTSYSSRMSCLRQDPFSSDLALSFLQPCYEIEINGADCKPVTVVCFNFSRRWWSWQIYNRHTLVRNVPCGNVESRERFVCEFGSSIHKLASGTTADNKAFVQLAWGGSCSFQRLDRLHKARNMLLDLLRCYTLTANFYMQGWHNQHLLYLCYFTLLQQTRGQKHVLHHLWY